MRWLVTLVAALAITLQAAPIPTSADTGKPELIWTNPHPKSVDDVLYIYRDTGTRTAAPPQAGPSSLDSCNEIAPAIWAVDGNHVIVWKLTVDVSWCYNGAAISYYYRYYWTYLGSSNWSDLGTVDDTVSSPTTGTYETDSYHKHHFAQCLGSCWGHTYPWILANVYANGTYYATAGT
jgi:hypothetical protein